jgi:hypothetical protein
LQYRNCTPLTSENCSQSITINWKSNWTTSSQFNINQEIDHSTRTSPVLYQIKYETTKRKGIKWDKGTVTEKPCKTLLDNFQKKKRVILNSQRIIEIFTKCICIPTVDTRRRATTALLLFNKRFTRLGEMKILLESSSSNLKLDTGPRNSGTWLVMIKGR